MGVATGLNYSRQHFIQSDQIKMIISKAIALLGIIMVFNCKGELIKVGDIELDLPSYTTSCNNHFECKDVGRPTGEYCTMSKRCSRKKDGNTWCFEDAECASNSCYVSSCTFLETEMDKLDGI